MPAADIQSSAQSMRGWILRAQTCAPVSPRKDRGGQQVAALFGGSTDGWASETAISFVHTRPVQRMTPFLPSPRSNLLGGDETPTDRYQSSMRLSHPHPGLSPRSQLTPRRSNDPSEPDHPMFGLHDPERLERLRGTFGGTSNRDTFRSFDRSAYSSPRRDPPYADSAHKAFCFDGQHRHTSEQQANYMWPAFIAQAPVKRPVPEWVPE